MEPLPRRAACGGGGGLPDRGRRGRPGPGTTVAAGVLRAAGGGPPQVGPALRRPVRGLPGADRIGDPGHRRQGQYVRQLRGAECAADPGRLCGGRRKAGACYIAGVQGPRPRGCTAAGRNRRRADRGPAGAAPLPGVSAPSNCRRPYFRGPQPAAGRSAGGPAGNGLRQLYRRCYRPEARDGHPLRRLCAGSGIGRRFAGAAGGQPARSVGPHQRQAAAERPAAGGAAGRVAGAAGRRVSD